MKFITAAVLSTSLLLVGCKEKPTDELVNDVRGGVVHILNQIDATTGGSGTGFILDDNQIVTNHHVIDGTGKITVYSNNSQRQYGAQVVYKDPIADIAIIRLYDWELFEKNENPTNLVLGDSDTADQGDRIIVVGHPWGLTWSVSEGIISGKSRRAGPNPKFMDQIDAHLFQGNSGGPIFDVNGKVICVSTMMLAQEGGSYGLCVPSNLVKKIIHDFNVLGEVRWRALNISADLTDDGSSVIVRALEPEGAAAKAGIKEGDKLLEIITPKNHPAGIKITEPNDLITELATLNGDEELVKLIIERSGEKMIIDVKTNYRLSSEYTPDKGR